MQNLEVIQMLNDRIRKNLEVLKELASNKTGIRKELLNNYSGWGGLGKAVFTLPYIKS